MSWIKHDTRFYGHPKVIAAGRDARDVYQAGLCWSGEYFTDGFLPAWCLVRLVADAAGGDGATIDPAAVSQRLVSVGLWEKAPGGFQIHDYLRHQTSRAKMRSTARKRAQAGALGGAAPSKQNGSKNEANDEANPEQTVEQIASATSPNGSANEPEELRSKKGEVVNTPPTPPLDAGGPSARESEPTELRILKPWERDLAEAERDPLFAPIVELDGRPLTRTAATRVCEHRDALNALGATPDEVRRRAANYRLIMSPGIPLTVRALLDHWERCDRPPAPEPADAEAAQADSYAAWGRALNERRLAIHERDEVVGQVAVAKGSPLPPPEPDEVVYVKPARAAPGEYAHPLAFGALRGRPGEVRQEWGARWAWEASAPGWRRLE